MKSLIATAAMGAAALAGPTAAQQTASPNSKAPVDVVADSAETSNTECVTTWRGNAEALQGDARLRADVLKTFSKKTPPKAGTSGASSGCGDMERIEAHGNVYIVKADQRVHGDDAVYLAGSTTFTVTGDVVAVRGQNVLRGDKMVFNTDTGEGQVIGKAKGRGAKDRPRGVFYPQSSSSTADKPK